MSADDQAHADVASLAEEIRLLVELVVERAAPWLEGVLAAGHGSEQDDEGRGQQACDWCPLCAVVDLARGEPPEFITRVLEQAAQLVALLRAVLADRWEPGEGIHMPGYRPAEPASDRASSRVQHIPVYRRAED